jgi:hypothetical protein
MNLRRRSCRPRLTWTDRIFLAAAGRIPAARTLAVFHHRSENR